MQIKFIGSLLASYGIKTEVCDEALKSRQASNPRPAPPIAPRAYRLIWSRRDRKVERIGERLFLL